MIGLNKYAATAETISLKLRMFNVSKVNSATLHDIEEEARDRICKAGSEVLVFSQLALRSPTGKGIVSLHSRMKARTRALHFGTPRKRGIEVKPLASWNGAKM